MRRRRDLREEPRVDVRSGAQQLDRLGGRRVDGVLALDEEETELVTPAPVVQLAHELELLVVARDDHAHSNHAAWWSTCARRRVSPAGQTVSSSAVPA